MKKNFYYLILSVLLLGCSAEPLENLENQQARLNSTAQMQSNNPHSSFHVPVLELHSTGVNSLTLEITAGATGATGGLSIRWMTLEEFNVHGWNDDMAGHVLLNGHANDGYSLAAGESLLFSLEDHVSGEGASWNRALECGQTYVIIVQAHQDGNFRKSSYSEPETFSTEPCPVDDPCEGFSAGSDNSVTYSYSEIDALVDDIGQVKPLYLSLLDQGVSRTGTFSPTIEQIWTDFRKRVYGNFTTTYTVRNEECEDSTVLTITVTRDPTN